MHCNVLKIVILYFFFWLNILYLSSCWCFVNTIWMLFWIFTKNFDWYTSPYIVYMVYFREVSSSFNSQNAEHFLCLVLLCYQCTYFVAFTLFEVSFYSRSLCRVLLMSVLKAMIMEVLNASTLWKVVKF